MFPIETLLTQRILVLDGAMGTMVQRCNLNEKDFRGTRFASHPCDVKGNNDLLSLTQPAVISNIHRHYLAAGADIISTNTFNSTRISQADYGAGELAYELNLHATRLARAAADAFTSTRRPRFVAGSMGPTNRTASLSPDVNDPGFRAVTFADLAAAYTEQVQGLVDGGADLLLVETVFDTLNAKAALYAIGRYFEQTGKRLPVMLSATITDASGRTLSGQTLEALLVSVAHFPLLSVGLNCAFGAAQMRPYLQEMADRASCFVSVHPNAGLPNRFGDYDETPESMCAHMVDYLENKLVNIAGGCCGTTPDHIRLIAEAVARYAPRKVTTPLPCLHLSGLEPLTVTPAGNFVNIGERTNVTGSAKFAKLIAAGQYEAALAVARQQIADGAQIIDVNMDEAMLDSRAAMVTFLHLAAAEPDIARVPVMLDSSNFEVIEAGLQCLQGKGIVNSISLKEGEEKFKAQARIIRCYGAAMVVMAFDEQGQADTFARRVAVCQRSYNILTRETGVAPHDIIFDPNVLAIGTGLEAHNNYAVDFIETVRWIKQHLPNAKVSGGISNLSFAFRGNNVLREAIHSVFLYHAIGAGLDMGIVNAGMLAVYEEIPKTLLDLTEDLVLNRRADATERLINYQTTPPSPKGESTGDPAQTAAAPFLSEDGLSHALVTGNDTHLEAAINVAWKQYGSALKIIEGPLMEGMNKVGTLFGKGKMFLPQVVKSARIMKKAVALLEPFLTHDDTTYQVKKTGKILLATVKGDVHDIGKNIVSVVLACNNFEVIDAGVMVPAPTIMELIKQEQPDMVALSGLITPSLNEMIHVAKEMERARLRIPLLIGGATTSKLHTAVKIAPAYSGAVVYTTDASRAALAAVALMSNETRDAFITQINEEYAALREQHSDAIAQQQLTPLSEARAHKPVLHRNYQPVTPSFTGIKHFADYPLQSISQHIHWEPFFHAWELYGRFPDLLQKEGTGAEATKLLDDAQRMLQQIIDERWLSARAVIGLWPANSVGDDMLVYAEGCRPPSNPIGIFHTLRQQTPNKQGVYYAAADFLLPASCNEVDYLGGFVATVGIGAEERSNRFKQQHDEYRSLLVQTLADRLTEAFAEHLHERVQHEFWGYTAQSHHPGIRPAIGFPCLPDHSEKTTLFRLLDAERHTGIHLTENRMMVPAAAVCGLYFAHSQAHYFHTGAIDDEQLTDYAARKQMDKKDLIRFLANRK